MKRRRKKMDRAMRQQRFDLALGGWLFVEFWMS